MSRWTWLAVAGFMIAPKPASAQYIGLFTDPGATSCVAQVGHNPRVDLHVIAVLEGSVTEMAGAQFLISGVPATWTPENVLWVPDVGSALSLGNPLFSTPAHPERAGVNIAFYDCAGSSTNRRVSLGRVVLLGPPTEDNVHLRVSWFDLVPPDPNCPFVVTCDAPIYSKVCVGGGEIVLNGDAPSSCQVAIEENTWTNVKSLYR